MSVDVYLRNITASLYKFKPVSVSAGCACTIRKSCRCLKVSPLLYPLKMKYTLAYFPHLLYLLFYDMYNKIRWFLLICICLKLFYTYQKEMTLLAYWRWCYAVQRGLCRMRQKTTTCMYDKCPQWDAYCAVYVPVVSITGKICWSDQRW